MKLYVYLQYEKQIWSSILFYQCILKARICNIYNEAILMNTNLKSWMIGAVKFVLIAPHEEKPDSQKLAVANKRVFLFYKK